MDANAWGGEGVETWIWMQGGDRDMDASAWGGDRDMDTNTWGGDRDMDANAWVTGHGDRGYGYGHDQTAL